MAARLRNYFLTGLVLVGPVYITISLTWWFINWVDNIVRPFIPIAYRTETYLPWQIPGTGLILALSALTLLGFLTANFVGRTAGRGERIHSQPDAGGASDLQGPQAGLRDLVLTSRVRASASAGWSSFHRPACGRWCSCRSRPARRSPNACPIRARCGVPAVHPQPDDRILLLRPPPERGRSRHYGRAGDDPVDVCRAWVQPGGSASSRSGWRRWPRPRAPPGHCRRPNGLRPLPLDVCGASGRTDEDTRAHRPGSRGAGRIGGHGPRRSRLHRPPNRSGSSRSAIAASCSRTATKSAGSRS